MIMNTQTVTQEPLFSDWGDVKSLHQILVSRKHYTNFKIWLHSLYIILLSWILWPKLFLSSRN